ncbi:MAG: 16S rRNA (adenine(1518)-N(6)/adenine(1519)-N(6))-dimethyltransferase RsmA [Planctomycetota bacterium]|nr:16S rRNA (adenine(1518)-N(6)/adenine(1519)-N(6))-dimethyltransferase RsmA [Planctomycetota bacterium]
MSEATNNPEGGQARPPRPPWKEFRESLEGHGFRPSRRFGQNFLLDENTARAIVADSGAGPGDRVLEVGTGCGFLTVHLAHIGLELLTVEIDLRLAEVSRPFLEPYPRVTLLEGDILEGKHALNSKVLEWIGESEPWHLVSNLPYAVSGPVVALCASLPNPPASMTVLVQKELGQRLAAKHNTPDYGPLSIVTQFTCDVSLIRDVGSGSFWPRPKVASSVVRMTLKDGIRDPMERDLAMQRIRPLFTRRRQTLVRVMGDLGADKAALREALAAAGHPENLRAECLAPEELADWVLGPLWPSD